MKALAKLAGEELFSNGRLAEGSDLSVDPRQEAVDQAAAQLFCGSQGGANSARIAPIPYDLATRRLVHVKIIFIALTVLWAAQEFLRLGVRIRWQKPLPPSNSRHRDELAFFSDVFRRRAHNTTVITSASWCLGR
jgi:hypothetical protein